ncbi:MAG: hypothetical protein K2G44_05725 [Clostridia bacterium]|nr:hypothetical protein [Clostridia bacterium]
MKDSAIEQMYEGERGKGELLKTSLNYKKYYDAFTNLYEIFRKAIENNTELLEMFDDVLDALGEAHAVDAKEKYAAGFRFGAHMQMDILRGE